MGPISRIALLVPRILVALLAVAVWASAPSAQEALRFPQHAKAAQPREFARLFDAVVEAVAKSFWDKNMLEAIGWQQRAAAAKPAVVGARSLAEAARRINALLGELKTSHTGLLTPDDVDYYILSDVFSGARSVKQMVADHFPGGAVIYAGIGIFSARIDNRDFVDAVLEGSAAERAGLKVGDEIVSVDGALYHPVRSFRGKIGERAAVTRRRAADAEPETLQVEVASIAPLSAFRDATLASARIIERAGRRIGYVHVWASVGDKSAKALADALAGLGVNRPPGNHDRADGDEQSRKEQVPPLDGLVIDMRGKIGGTGSNSGRYLDILDPRGPLVRSRNKGATDRARTAVRGRTAVLIDHHTRSTAELFVHAYKRERQGPLIGTRTAGAVSAAAAFAMPGGNLLYLAVSGLEVDGEILEGPGVSPDIEVARPLAYAQGADPVLDVAVDYLAGRAKRAAPQPDAPAGSN